MKLSHHIIASLAASAGAYALTRSIPAAALTLGSGVLVDCDHVIDYVVMFRPPYSVKAFLTTFYEGRIERVFVVLHSWELIILLVAVAAVLGWPALLTGLLAGIGHHLLLDQFANRAHPLGYFLTYRIATGFSHRKSFPTGGLTRPLPPPGR